MNDYLTFKKMVTPLIIQAAFWLGVAGYVIMAIMAFMGDQAGLGLVYLAIGPLVWRIICEIVIILFSINDTLTQTRNLLRERA